MQSQLHRHCIVARALVGAGHVLERLGPEFGVWHQHQHLLNLEFSGSVLGLTTTLTAAGLETVCTLPDGNKTSALHCICS